ncbi:MULTISPECIES: NACHT domain-containing NTPase [unclassified Microcoleus]|uniref:NACHT domain-containing protein n=1 Tax=unclassified Microcoleus TaxID=2642155 RepID=UPI0025D1E11F|nr:MULTISPECIES: NACHT domain-containing NTPase [unclassified Microcoleus]
MQSLPREFLAKLAKKYDLSPEQEEAFVARFSGKESNLEIAETMFISESAFGTRMNGVYRKFSIGGKGPGKLRKLHDFLLNEYQKSNFSETLGFSNKVSGIDELVEEMRQRIRPIIQERCGTMRVLDMNQPIGLNDIYTHVNILEKITGRKRLQLSQLPQQVSPQEFDRFSLGSVKEQRVPGLKAIEKHNKLMILGKPGAGKTTFLKHLAIQCIGSVLQVHRVPIFITLKDFAEADGQPDLISYINSLISSPAEIKNFSSLQTPTPTQQILENGRTLIFLDGLDEVRETDAKRVLRQIQQFADNYSRNAFVITCRIAAREYTFQQFTEVEVADFDDVQIADFSKKWFHCKQDTLKADRFIQKLRENPPIYELATNPLLLTLLCLVFEDSGDFPANRAELYQNGVDVLLKKWDIKRNIDRDEVYKKLSLKRKEDLLSQIAYRTFEAGNYFFKQKGIELQIREFIENLPGASTDEQTLDLDSEVVLKSIEAQHGLFVERARSIYSFSHLTFHEYFTAKYIVAQCNFSSIDDPILNKLVERLTEVRWREVFLLTIEMLPESTTLLLLMKRKVDSIMSVDSALQDFLYWVHLKSLKVNDDFHQPVALRVFYFCLECIYGLHIFYEDEPIDIMDKFRISRDGMEGIFSLDFDVALYRLFSFSNCCWFSPKNALANLVNDIVQHYNLRYSLKNDFEALIKSLPDFPDPEENKQQFQEIWENVQSTWTEQLRKIMIKYRRLGCDWQFSKQQIEMLKEYYEANNFLLDCLDSDCYVSRSVREEIEENLLLPIAEIEKRKREESE